MSVVELVPHRGNFATTETSLELVSPAYALAERIAKTEFVPTALRGKPDAILAAILTGHELGIAPMMSLAKIHVIEGRPAMAAELMRALVLAAGHELWIAESNNTKCTVGAKRHGSEREASFTWTMDDAKRAGLDGKQNWRKYPRAMLLARATAETVRAVFPDVVAGVSYSVEELTDGEMFDVDDAATSPPAAGDAAPAPGRRRARRPATAAAAPVAAPATPAALGAAARDLPPLPGEEDVIEVSGSDSGKSPGPMSDGGGEEEEHGTPDSSPSPDEGGALPLPAQVSIWIREAQDELHPGLNTKESEAYRHAFLAAMSEGAISSATKVTPAMVPELRATLVRLRRGELLLDQTGERPVLRTRATGLPTSDPAGQHAQAPGRTTNLDEAAWRDELDKVAGVGPVSLIKQSWEIAERLGLPKAQGLDEITDPQVTEALLDWLHQRGQA